MPKTSFKELLDAGVHFGHLKRKWNPAMAPYIFMEKNGIHIIDLNKTESKLNEAASAMKQIAKSGRKILFVATKKQAKDIVAEKVKEINMPYVTERWPGGMLTNFPTIRKAVKKMAAIDKMSTDGTFNHLSKRERLQITRQRAKLEKNLGSIADLTRLPAAMFIVDVHKEYIAVREANRLNIPVFAMVDTNSDPRDIDFPIPSNDDASKSIALIINYVCDSVAEGLSERKMEKEKEATESKAKKLKADSQKAEAAMAAKESEAPAGERSEVKTGERREAGSRKRTDGGRRSESRKVESAKVETKEVKAEVKEEVKAEVKEEKKAEKGELQPEELSQQEKNAEKKEEKSEPKEEKTVPKEEKNDKTEA